MTNIYFIDEEYLRNYAPISAAVDTALIFPFVRSAQEENILPIVGRALYERLKTSIDTDAVTEDEEKLLALLRDALAWKTLEQYIVFGSIRLRNTGLVRQKGDTIEPASLEEITFFLTSASTNICVTTATCSLSMVRMTNRLLSHQFRIWESILEGKTKSTMAVMKFSGDGVSMVHRIVLLYPCGYETKQVCAQRIERNHGRFGEEWSRVG
jgi:hypothetical protein